MTKYSTSALIKTNLGSLLHGSSRPASSTGRTIGTPRRYDLMTAVLFAGRRRRAFSALATAAGARPGDRILDVGCGTGFFARLLADIVGSKGEVLGVDAAPEMVAHAVSRSRSLSNCRFEVGNAGALAYPNGSFDGVVSSLTMHHLAAEEQLPAVREMRRLLRPAGRLLVAEFHAPTGHGWNLLLRPTGLAAMRRAVPRLESLIAEVGFVDIERGEVPPWLHYVRATNRA
jgi:ubiquinone/menaquinone biosynthesis C-methylase UbiE